MELKYIDNDIEKFIFSLEKQTIGKVLRTINLLITWGHLLGWPHSKKLANHLFELRVKGKQEVRIFYTICGSSAYLLHGFVKKTQKTPKREFRVAFKKLLLVD